MNTLIENTFMDYCMVGLLDLAKETHQKMASISRHVIEATFSATCGNGHVDVVKWMLEVFHETIYISQYSGYAFLCATSKGHVEVCKLFVPHLVNNIHFNNRDFMKQLVYGVLINGHLNVLKWLFDIEPDAFTSVINSQLFSEACRLGHLEIAKWILELKPDICIIMSDHLMFKQAINNQKLKIVKWFQSLKPEYYDIVYNENGTIQSYYIRTKEEAEWYKKKYAIWLSSEQSPNKECILFKIPQDVSRHIIEMI